MAKLTSGGTDVGLLYTETLTANGSTTGYVVPAKRLVNVAMARATGSTCSLECSYDGGVTWFGVAPLSLSVIDSTTGNTSMTLYEEEQNVWYRMTVTGYASGDAIVRFSSAALT